MGINLRHRTAGLGAALATVVLLAGPAGAPALTGTTPTTAPSNAGGTVAPGGPASTPAATVTTPAATVTTPAATVTTPPAPRTTPPATAPGTATPAAPATHAATKGAGKLSSGALAAALLAGLIALACLLWGIFRVGAFEPHWLLSLRHSLAEAGLRASATWAEFSDWVRLGH